MSSPSRVQDNYLNRYQEDPGQWPASEGSQGDSYENWDGASDPWAPENKGYSQGGLSQVEEGGEGYRPDDEEIFAGLDLESFDEGIDSADSWDAAADMKALEEKIQSHGELSPEQKDSLLKKLEELKAESLSGQGSPEDLQYALEEISDQVLGWVEEVKTERTDDLSQLKYRIENFEKNQLDNPKLPQEIRAVLAGQIEAVQASLQDSDSDLKSLEEKFEGIQNQFERELKTSELKSEFKNLPSQITKTGVYWRATESLSILVSEALDSGHWTGVEQYLEANEAVGWKNEKRHKRVLRRTERRIKRKGADRGFAGDSGKRTREWEFSHKAVQQLVGELYYKVAQGDREKLHALLSLMPESVVEHMVGALEHAENDFTDGQYVGSEGQKQATGYFGTAQETALFLEQHLEWDSDRFFRTDSLEFSLPETPAPWDPETA